MRILDTPMKTINNNKLLKNIKINRLYHKRKFTISKDLLQRREYSIYEIPSSIRNGYYDIYDNRIQLLSVNNRLA